MFRQFHTRKPRSGSLGEIGCNLDLANERKHIRGKPVIEQDFRINLAVPGIGLGFVQDRGEVIQRLEKGWHRRLVHREGHRRGPLLVGEEDYPQ
jgi:hypothetical protein